MTDVQAPDRGVKRALRRMRKPQQLRNRELVLLIFAIALTFGAFTLVQFGAIGELDTKVLGIAYAKLVITWVSVTTLAIWLLDPIWR